MGKLQAKQRSLHRFLPVFFLIGLSVIIVEGVEHYFAGENFFSIHYLIEMAIFGIGMPLLGLLLLFLAERARVERDRTVDILEKHLAFNEEVKTTVHYDELMARIARFPQKVVPAVSTFLHIYDVEKSLFRLGVIDGQEPVQVPPEITREVCRACLLANPSDCTPRMCALVDMNQPANPVKRYMMPLVYGKAIVAILHFDLQSDEPLTIAQIHTLKGLAPNMALAIESASLRNSHGQLVEAALAERQAIAQELHDSLAQNLTYLRLKLDQFSSQDTLEEIVSIRKDLRKMRDIANNAYDQVRNTLAALHQNRKSDLLEGFRTHAHNIARRNGLKLNYRIRGEPICISSYIQRQVTYICREALNNIEKHASAKRIEIEFVWQQSALVVRIKDDGIGFDPATSDKDDNFGISIMHELAAEINATVMIRSARKQGTELTLYLPIEKSSPNSLPNDRNLKVAPQDNLAQERWK